MTRADAVRRALAVLLVAGLGPSLAAPAGPGGAAEPPPFDFVASVRESVAFLTIPDWDDRPCPETVTREQSLEDVAMPRCLFDTAYSGTEYWRRQGVDLDSAWAGLRRRILAEDEGRVSVANLETAVCEALRGINDGHLRVSGFQKTTLQRRTRARFAEVVLERQGQEFVVVQSQVAGLRPGDRYRDAPAHLFRTLAAAGHEAYLHGVLSPEEPDTVALEFASGRRALPLHRCRLGGLRNQADDPAFERRDVDGFPVAVIRRFYSPNAIEQLEAFVEYGKQARAESLLVIDLVNNGGGDAEYADRFVRNLSAVSREAGYEPYLHSPAICQAFLPGKNGWALRTMPARPERRWEMLPRDYRFRY